MRILTTLILSITTLASAQDRPNIIVYITDDVGWKDFGCYGNDVIRTPNIDALAERGLLFENAFLTIAQCSPSRISIMTGRYPHATGAEDLHMPLPEGTKMIPAHLKEADYFSGGMQKMHFGPHGEAQFDWYDRGLDKLGAFLDESNDNPFFLWVGFRDAHRPYDGKAFDPPQDPATVIVPPYLVDTPETRKDLADYYDEITRLDSVIGEHMALLKARGEFKDTIVIFLNDNGMPFPRAKGTVYDSGIGTALIIAWPGVIEQGRRVSELASVVDLAPTILEMAGLDPTNRDYQGKSIMSALTNDTFPSRQYVFSERNWHNCDEHIRSVRTARYKLIRNAYLDRPHGTAADIGQSPSFADLLELKEAGTLSPAQAALFTVPRPEYELYDLKDDPWETNNIANDPDMADVLAQLSTVLDEWSANTGDFSPEYRRRADNTDRFTGVKFLRKNPEMTHPLPK